MNAILYDVALTVYIVATAASFAYLVGRRERFWRLGVLMTEAGWVCHTAALIVRGVELGRFPLMTLPEVVSVVIWVAVLMELLALALKQRLIGRILNQRMLKEIPDLRGNSPLVEKLGLH